jgi:hypothetical protein
MISANTIDDVVKIIYHDSEYNKIIRNLIYKSAFKNEHFDDIWQELILIMYNSPSIINAYNQGEFKYWFIFVAEKNICSSKSPLYYKFLKKESITDKLDFNTDSINSNAEDDILSKIDNEYIYNIIYKIAAKDILISKNDKRNFEIFKLFFIEKYKLREIYEHYNKQIPMTNIHNYIKAVKNKIKNGIDDDLFNEYRENYN